MTQQLSTRAQHDRQFRRLDAEALDQSPRAGIAARIEHLVRLSIALQESGQPKHITVAGAADDQRTRDAALNQTDAAQDQRAHDALAELGLRDENVAQPGGRDDERFDRLHGARVHQRPRTVGDDRLFAPECVVLRDRDLAVQDHEHAGADVAGRDQLVVCLIGAEFAEPLQAADLGRLERREHLIEAGLDDRTLGRGHACVPLSQALRSSSRSSERSHHERTIERARPLGGCRFRAARSST